MPASASKSNFPKRSISIGRIFRHLLIMLVAIAIGHGIWNWQADRSLQARIETLRTAGGRVLPSEFVGEGIAWKDNGAPLLHAAAAILNDDTTEYRSVDFVPTTMPVPEKAWPYLNRAVEWFAPALQRIDMATAKPQCQWQHCLESPVLEKLKMPELSEMRDLAGLLAASALVGHHFGNDALVLHRLDQMLQLSRSLEPTPSSVGHHVATDIVKAAVFRVEHVAPDLHVGVGPTDAAPQDVRKLIDTLLDEKASIDGLHASLDASRMRDLDMLQTLPIGRASEWPAWNRVVTYWAGPVLRSSALVTLNRGTDSSAIVFGATDWPDARQALDRMPPFSQGRLNCFAWDAACMARGVGEDHFRGLTDRRLAAVALAIRLFVVDHQGSFPASLDQLVPNYLPSVPLDAMAAGNQPIGYVNGAQPVLYSVGPDGNNDRASEAAMPNLRGELDEWRRLDRVFYLTVRERLPLSVHDPDENIAVGEYAENMRPPWVPPPPPPSVEEASDPETAR